METIYIRTFRYKWRRKKLSNEFQVGQSMIFSLPIYLVSECAILHVMYLLFCPELYPVITN